MLYSKLSGRTLTHTSYQSVWGLMHQLGLFLAADTFCNAARIRRACRASSGHGGRRFAIPSEDDPPTKSPPHAAAGSSFISESSAALGKSADMTLRAPLRLLELRPAIRTRAHERLVAVHTLELVLRLRRASCDRHGLTRHDRRLR